MSGTGAGSGPGAGCGPGAGSGPGMLRRLLRAFEEAPPGEGLAQIADRLGIDRAEAADLAAYWVRKGRLRREEIGGRDCGGCRAATRGCTACPGGDAPPASNRPVLVALAPVRPPAAGAAAHLVAPAQARHRARCRFAYDHVTAVIRAGMANSGAKTKAHAGPGPGGRASSVAADRIRPADEGASAGGGPEEGAGAARAVAAACPQGTRARPRTSYD
ncbi:helix-turn-helix domain-containing protein [Streptomyces sp. NBC_01244]|uniref:helix-turn-helix domain-containing protein n=1 Tax=Streptomyces sp. NBC_01244 TaxID=2903797 RepID=UPI002E14D93A|nr:FeoC-like transcriptional regulator [Streptomyces sp. NBC_01244]